MKKTLIKIAKNLGIQIAPSRIKTDSIQKKDVVKPKTKEAISTNKKENSNFKKKRAHLKLRSTLLNLIQTIKSINIINKKNIKKTNPIEKKIAFDKKYLDRLAKLNQELPFLKQRTVLKGKTVREQAIIKKTRKKVQKHTKNSRTMNDPRLFP
ncbi:hypothetical protein [Aquimarina pacifica]|uniref:hypothetical protein n=1 Tax=Aquimarina pacifica TaxID=1296415 RepID=UPI0004707551|nr:hypothetical protein [Aquimarina pacifica]